jgi:hypothetical protein
MIYGKLPTPILPTSDNEMTPEVLRCKTYSIKVIIRLGRILEANTFHPIRLGRRGGASISDKLLDCFML